MLVNNETFPMNRRSIHVPSLLVKFSLSSTEFALEQNIERRNSHGKPAFTITLDRDFKNFFSAGLLYKENSSRVL
jgi:hypothetical protein